MSGFHIDLQILDVHRRELQALISGLPDAKAAGADNVGNFEAWGLAGQPFALLMNQWTGDASEYVDAVKEAGDVLVQRFADMCKTYADQEEAAVQMFQKLRHGLDGGQS
ncbi:MULTISPECIES: hypothetical protein [Lentzea]|uniref:Excreted virulence factor EspC, type VII ESX diderm n=1 Tax=Lentzea albida TaxID=65499 RepID=A0A1H9B719_9PSEU|nr:MULTISPECIES: hypothetical protein [Lentzea]USX49664.1 hypothetical protein ND450_30155 [Lentzea sp. HUAS12]SEP84501.1 hypothetical protein SAMN04488000_101422 [Lentzea albida]